ncbi:MAG: phospho-sugar mutase [Firmicutes bacterium]|nr:phospho-sugar mutase [Bacillota bacterium]
MNNDPTEKYKEWCRKAVNDPDLAAELREMQHDTARIRDAFYRDLDFGTAGLRGIIGAGTDRMNVYTVAKATQGLAGYLKKRYDAPSAAISFDSRIKSDVFARVAAGVLAANGIKVHIWPQLMPVPVLSYSVRALGASAGIMITASHNPAAYNGYKVYGEDGCQITTEAAKAILSEIEKLDIFEDIKTSDFSAGLAGGQINYISDEVYTAFTEEVKKQSVLYGDETDKNIAIVYSPLNGSGLRPVTRALRESGYTNITIVKEQEQPDGRFPTCPSPNPEIREAMALGLQYAKLIGADLLLATDPDCDRAGIAVKDPEEKDGYTLLTGNQTGVLLLDYICSQRIKHGVMPPDPVMIKSIVTTDLAAQVAESYGVRTVNVLTGFKFIGEQILKMEKLGKADSFIFGFEESYGYLSGAYVRDKDGVDAALLICEMFCYYASRGISLTERLAQIYEKHGYCHNSVYSYTFEGAAGFEHMKGIMNDLRRGVAAVAGRDIIKTVDFADGPDGLPPADVLKFVFDGGSVIVRPSGTELKLKAYITVSASDRKAADAAAEDILRDIIVYFK